MIQVFPVLIYYPGDDVPYEYKCRDMEEVKRVLDKVESNLIDIEKMRIEILSETITEGNYLSYLRQTLLSCVTESQTAFTMSLIEEFKEEMSESEKGGKS